MKKSGPRSQSFQPAQKQTKVTLDALQITLAKVNPSKRVTWCFVDFADRLSARCT